MKDYRYFVFNIKSAVTVATSLALVICVIITVYLASVSRTSTASAEVNETASIIIDAGHGGMDGGTQSADGILEKDLNLSIAHKLNDMLTELGYSTVMTRTQDGIEYEDGAVTVRQKKVSDTKNRLKIIEENPDAVFVSIHQNYFTQSKYSGTQVFFSGNNEKSQLLAESIQKSVVSSLQPDNKRAIKKSGSDIYLLYHAQIPAVMVECGFLSNVQEAKLLSDEEYQQKLALAVLKGIQNYFLQCE